MKKAISTVVCAVFALTGCAHGAGNGAEDGEARLGRMLEGRIPGEPRSCIPASVDRRLQVIDETAVVYDAGETIYVARPSDPRSLDSDDILVIERFSTQLCKQDVVRTVDQQTGFLTGLVFLGDFVPYR